MYRSEVSDRSSSSASPLTSSISAAGAARQRGTAGRRGGEAGTDPAPCWCAARGRPGPRRGRRRRRWPREGRERSGLRSRASTGRKTPRRRTLSFQRPRNRCPALWRESRIWPQGAGRVSEGRRPGLAPRRAPGPEATNFDPAALAERVKKRSSEDLPAKFARGLVVAHERRRGVGGRIRRRTALPVPLPRSVKTPRCSTSPKRRTCPRWGRGCRGGAVGTAGWADGTCEFGAPRLPRSAPSQRTSFRMAAKVGNSISP